MKKIFPNQIERNYRNTDLLRAAPISKLGGNLVRMSFATLKAIVSVDSPDALDYKHIKKLSKEDKLSY